MRLQSWTQLSNQAHDDGAPRKVLSLGHSREGTRWHQEKATDLARSLPLYKTVTWQFSLPG